MRSARAAAVSGSGNSTAARRTRRRPADRAHPRPGPCSGSAPRRPATRVAGRVAEPVVDAFETVKVDERHCGTVPSRKSRFTSVVNRSRFARAVRESWAAWWLSCCRCSSRNLHRSRASTKRSTAAATSPAASIRAVAEPTRLVLHLAGPPGPLLGQFVETAFERLELLVHHRAVVQRPRLGPAPGRHQPEFVLDAHPIDLEVVSDHGSGVAHAEVLQPVQFGVRPGDQRAGLCHESLRCRRLGSAQSFLGDLQALRHHLESGERQHRLAVTVGGIAQSVESDRRQDGDHQQHHNERPRMAKKHRSGDDVLLAGDPFFPPDRPVRSAPPRRGSGLIAVTLPIRPSAL